MIPRRDFHLNVLNSEGRMLQRESPQLPTEPYVLFLRKDESGTRKGDTPSPPPL